MRFIYDTFYLQNYYIIYSKIKKVPFRTYICNLVNILSILSGKISLKYFLFNFKYTGNNIIPSTHIFIICKNLDVELIGRIKLISKSNTISITKFNNDLGNTFIVSV